MVSAPRLQRAVLLSATLGLVHAVTIPEPTPAPAQVEFRAPVVTPAAVHFDGRYSYMQRRNVIDDIANDVGGFVKSLAKEFGSAVPSFFTEGMSTTPIVLQSYANHPLFRRASVV